MYSKNIPRGLARIYERSWEFPRLISQSSVKYKNEKLKINQLGNWNKVKIRRKKHIRKNIRRKSENKSETKSEKIQKLKKKSCLVWMCTYIVYNKQLFFLFQCPHSCLGRLGVIFIELWIVSCNLHCRLHQKMRCLPDTHMLYVYYSVPMGNNRITYCGVCQSKNKKISITALLGISIYVIIKKF